MGKVKIFYFSPTGSTRQAAQHLGDLLGELLGTGVEYRSYTLPREREVLPQVEAGDVVVCYDHRLQFARLRPGIDLGVSDIGVIFPDIILHFIPCLAEIGGKSLAEIPVP